MRRIKPLPEAVRSSVRSGIILYDLTRVVEELVFNSLDAGATEVSVAVGVGTCFVKVADNGSGIDRDGLVLLGERFATSKHDHLADLDASDGSFGFRGEALCSISDVSVLEIITKSHGMPHGYRKVMKGCKCLYLGINDDRHDAGTTVNVRDLFYNQPVRRKHMQSSPKKVLHLVKKCVLRVALVHSMVSFKVVDIESQDELLRTCSSPSPLSLLSTNFGTETASSLYELKASKGEFKLSGYLSGPCGILSFKAFQYIYINSRFVCKGPLHKLLNQLAAVYWDSKKYNICGRNEKQSKFLPYPTFILNLSCPRSHYDINFEPLKSAVEFMDWVPVFEFVQDTVTHFWSKNVSYDLPDYWESRIKRSRTHEWQSPVDVPFLQSEKLIEDYSLHASKDSLSSCQMSNGDAELKKHQKDAFLIRGADSAIHLDDTSQFACRMTTNKSIHSGVSLSSSLYFDEDYNLVNELSTKESCGKQIDYFLESKWQNGLFEVEDQMTMSTRSPVCANFHEFRDGADNNPLFVKPSKLSYLKGMSLEDIGPSFTGQDKMKFSNADFNKRRKHVYVDDDVDVGDKDDIDEIFEESKPRHGIVKPLWLFSRCTNQHDEIMKSKSLSHDVNSSSIAGVCSDEENYLVSHSLRHDKNFGCDWLSSTSEWLARIPNCLFSQISDADHSVGECVRSEYGKGVRYDYFRDREGKYCNFTHDTAGNWLDVGPRTDFLFDSEFYVGRQGDFSEVRGHKVKDSCVTNCSGVFPDEVNWLCTNTNGKGILLNSSDPLSHTALYTKLDRNKRARVQMGNKEAQFHKRETRRSNSAPPFYKHRRKFFDLNNLFKIEAGQIDSDDTCPEITNPKHELQAFDQRHLPSKEKCADDPLCIPGLENEAFLKRGQYITSSFSNHIEDSMSKEIQDVSKFNLKWQKSCEQDVGAMRSRNAGDCDTILDISSGILHFAGDSLVPTSIDKTCLRDAKVLQQVDKKFIPVVAGSVLAVIDQHAADERIRLEELRQKVLSGEMKQITYLDAEKELVLPEIGYQLLQNYKDQIQNWGWICNIYGQGSRSFAKKMNLLHRRRTVAKLVAVPCILGVNLTDTDLLEFLQQLADTDGSSTIPPSVIRILNNKACRGAIMFGDTLLHSECSLIVEELKQTSLCFQCAHGRPTTVPLVNLDLLHKQIAKLGSCRNGTQELWHGLCRHEISLERAECRLS